MPKEEDIGFSRALLSALATFRPQTRILHYLNYDSGVRVVNACVNAIRSNAGTDKAEVQSSSPYHWFGYQTNSVRDELTTSYCNEKNGRWPDNIAHIPLNDLDEFFDHADVCPYHGSLLVAEDTKLDETFDSTLALVRGLDPHGCIDDWQRFSASAEKLKRNLDDWKKEAELKQEFSFDFVGLYNDGRRIATAGRFVDLNAQPSTHELNPKAGLQIRGITGKNPDDDVLLGFYPLAGVRHLDTEQLLDLPNGFTVGLLVQQHDETRFTVGFRCVNTEVIHNPRFSTSMAQARTVDAGSPTRAPSIPAFMAAAISRAQLQPRHLVGLAVVALVLWVLIPFLRSPKTNEPANSSVPGASVADAHPSSPPSPPVASLNPTRKEPLLPLPQFALVQQQIGKSGAYLNKMPHPPGAQKTPHGNGVHSTRIWMVQMYGIGPDATEYLIATHYADSERLKDGLEDRARELSWRFEVVADPKQLSQEPNTGYVVKWATSYWKKKMTSVQAEIVKRGTFEQSLPSMKRDCSMVSCDERLLVTTMITDVYGVIGEHEKPPTPFADNKSNGCGRWFVMPRNALPANGFSNTGSSGEEFDDLDPCSPTSDVSTQQH